MKWTGRAVIALGLAVPLPQARADDELFRCGTIADATQRLACYDARVRGLYEKSLTARPSAGKRAAAARPPAGVAGGGPQAAALNAGETTVAEVIAGFHELRGQMVTTPGILLVTVDDASLYADPSGAESVSINLAKLDGETRLAVFRKCARGCAAAVTGRLTSATLGPQILAATVRLR